MKHQRISADKIQSLVRNIIIKKRVNISNIYKDLAMSFIINKTNQLERFPLLKWLGFLSDNTIHSFPPVPSEFSLSRSD